MLDDPMDQESLKQFQRAVQAIPDYEALAIEFVKKCLEQPDGKTLGAVVSLILGRLAINKDMKGIDEVLSDMEDYLDAVSPRVEAGGPLIDPNDFM